MADDVLQLTCELIRKQSITPVDDGAQALLAERLNALGFRCEDMSHEGVTNLWATHGSGAPLFVFAGHTDVVPTGPLEQWTSDPFEPEIRDGHLYGRGSADMKASLAAMLVATQHYLAGSANHKGQIAFLITSDEEGPSVHGTRHVVEQLKARNITPTYCVVGEPSSTRSLGDMVRIGRRGSLNGTLTVKGVQGHVAYPEEADNPIHAVAAALAEFADTLWDQGNEHYPPTSAQITNIHGGTGATNVIPGHVVVDFNLRFNTEQTAEGLEQRVSDLFARHELNFALVWTLSGNPFLTGHGRLIEETGKAVQAVCGLTPALSTGGGTSDGRFISPMGCELLELGPVNATIHKVDEHVRIADLEPLVQIYQGILSRLLV